MSVPDYTLVLGVDAGHLEQLRQVWPNWMRYKPSLGKVPLVIFYDTASVIAEDIVSIVGTEPRNFTLVPWPPRESSGYEHDASSRFGDAQRYKMLSGFVHVPARNVLTPYWLKLDLDVVATGKNGWISEEWFEDNPAIVAHPWGYTKPPDSMLKLDQWAEQHHVFTPAHPPLNLKPEVGSSIVRHKRIISWCAFFNTNYTKYCAAWASHTMGLGKLPQPSQDGYLWYMARRSGQKIVRTSMKNCGWQHCNGIDSIKRAVQGISTCPIA